MEAKVNGVEGGVAEWFAAHPDSDRLFIYLFGDALPETGKSWCPDCAQAEPLIRKAAVECGAALYDIAVGTRDVYKNNPEHPARIHPKIQLKAIPTLIAWHKESGPGARLVEDECKDPAKLEKLFQGAG